MKGREEEEAFDFDHRNTYTCMAIWYLYMVTRLVGFKNRIRRGGGECGKKVQAGKRPAVRNWISIFWSTHTHTHTSGKVACCRTTRMYLYIIYMLLACKSNRWFLPVALAAVSHTASTAGSHALITRIYTQEPWIPLL